MGDDKSDRSGDAKAEVLRLLEECRRLLQQTKNLTDRLQELTEKLSADQADRKSASEDAERPDFPT
jgi:hypothetical protein